MCYGYHIWSKEALMQAENDDDLDGGQRSSEVKWGKLCAMATIFGQKKPWCKLRMMMTFGGQRSSEVKWGKLCAMATIFGQKNWWCKLRMMMTFMEVKGHQRSNMVTLCAMATIFGQNNCWCKLRMTMTFTEVKGHQRSNVVHYATFLNIVILYYIICLWG